MSSASSTTPPSPTEIENLGVLFVGFVAATVLYGLTFFQTYIYYSRYPKDRRWIRYLVAVLCTLDTSTSVLVSEVLYYYLIILFDVNMDVLYATTTFSIQYMLSVVLTFISHIFFTHRVFQVTGGSKPVTLILIFLSFVAMVFGLVASGQMLAQPKLSAFGSLPMKITAAMNQAIGMMVDAIVSGMMCYSLRRARYPELVSPSGLVQTATTVLVGRGLAFTAVQMAYFCIFIAAPSRPYWIALQMVAGKVYVNTLLGHLNSRDVKLGQGLNEEDSLTDNKVPVNRRLPASIGLDVSDTKATTQTISFNTRHTDTESEGMELESRKTYQDQDDHAYTQVSSGSTQSQSTQADEADKKSLSEQLS